MKVRKKKKEYKIEYFLNEMKKDVSVNGDGNLSYKGFDAGEMLRLLQYFIDFPQCAEHLDKSKLIRRAYKDSYHSNDFTEENFLRNVKSHINQELQTKENIFYLLTTLSLNCSTIQLREFDILDCHVKLSEHFAETFSGREKVLEKVSKEIGACKDLNGYARVEVKVKSRNQKEALSRALDAVNIIKALANTQVNNGGIIYGDFYKPINKIRLGKAHTLHSDEGEAFDYPVFYEPEFKEAPVELPKNTELFQKNIENILNWISISPYSKKLYNVLLRCTDALDLSDKNVSVIKLWGALESIAADGEPNCDKLPTRLSALYKDFEYTKHIVMHIRDYRNEHVHQGIGDEESIHRAYHLQNLFNNIFLYYARPENGFKTLKEANEMLDRIAIGKDRLNSEITALNKALSFYS